MRSSMSSDKDKKTSGPDAKELAGRDLPKAQFPGRAPATFRIFMDESVHAQVLKHAQENLSIEICGVLVGQWQQDQDGPYAAISAAIPGDAAGNKFAEVTFTHETWAKINQRMDKEFADRRIVGWYHTHPDFGIFLSDRDRFIHEHFFSDPGQIAYVVDPKRKEEGIFTWSQGKPKAETYYWIGSRLQLGSGKDEPMEKPRTGAIPTVTQGTRSRPEESYRGDGGILTIAMWLLVGLLLGYLIASQYFSAQREQYLIANVARFAIAKSLKPGLGPNLQRVNDQLGATMLDLDAIAARPTTMPAQVYENMRGQLYACRKVLSVLQSVYALSDEEELALAKLDVGALGMQGQGADAPTTQPATQPATRPAH